ncbi:MAG: hypothetical protein AB1728_07655 [Bacteroidota bacterium]
MKKILLLVMMFRCPLFSQGWDASITLKGTFTTSTRFLYDIDREIYSGEHVLESNYGYGGDVRWNMLWDRFYFGVGVEKVRSSEITYVVYTHLQDLRVPSEEGFDMSALELSGYYIVPISSENIRFYIGGGFGLYDGERIHRYANVQAATIKSESNIGIHVMTGIDYKINSRLAARGELKFRDPHFTITDKFDKPYAEFHNARIPLSQRERTTQINLFGVNYMLGLAVTL